jgi:hypothetical protein
LRQTGGSRRSASGPSCSRPTPSSSCLWRAWSATRWCSRGRTAGGAGTSRPRQRWAAAAHARAWGESTSGGACGEGSVRLSSLSALLALNWGAPDNTAQTDTTQLNPTQPNPTQPNTIQPTPNRHDPTQHNTTQPNPTPQAPVVLPVKDKLVYSPHVYGPDVHGQPYFSDPAVSHLVEGILGGFQGFCFAISPEIGPSCGPRNTLRRGWGFC